MTNLILSLSFLGAFVSHDSKLEVTVNNIRVGKGNVAIAIYDTKEKFLKTPVAGSNVKASDQAIDFSFDIPDGTYAVAVYQDINENNDLDKGWFSIPKEPYGLSNNYRPRFSAPTFDNCKFNVTHQTAITITLK